MRRSIALLILVAAVPVAVTAAVAESGRGPRLGRQPDGSFYVSTGQHIPPAAVAFPGRPIDLALHPSRQFFAVLSKSEVFLADSSGVITFHGRPLNVTRALANQDLGLEEIDDAIWRVWFLATPLGHFDERRWRWVSPEKLD